MERHEDGAWLRGLSKETRPVDSREDGLGEPCTHALELPSDGRFPGTGRHGVSWNGRRGELASGLSQWYRGLAPAGHCRLGPIRSSVPTERSLLVTNTGDHSTDQASLEPSGTDVRTLALFPQYSPPADSPLLSKRS